MPNLDRYPCPCCGRLVHQQMPGFHQRCPVCGWEDDLAQLRFPLMPGSSNAVSLREAQQHVQAYGASERRRLGSTRSAVDGEEVNLGWRPLDIERDNALHRVPVFRWGFRALAELAKRTMNRTQTLELLSQHKAHFARLYGVTGLVLFGFTVRGEAREDSDIDILVGFDGPATSERYFGVQFYLEDLLGRSIWSRRRPCVRSCGPTSSARRFVSDPGGVPRAWAFYLGDMIGFAEKVLAASSYAWSPWTMTCNPGFSILNADGGGIRRGPRRLRYDQDVGTMRLQIAN